MLRCLLLVTLCLLTGCQRSTEKAVIVGNSWLGAAPFFSAAVTQPELIPAKLKPVMLVSDVSVLRMLSNDAAAGAFLTLDNALGLNTMTQGDYCVAMVIDRSQGADAILAREGWAYDARKPLLVGLEDSTLARYVLARWMTTQDVPPEQVMTQALLPTEHLQAWSNTEIDLIVTYQPFVERLKQRGAQVIFDSQNQALNVTDVLIIQKQRWAEIAFAVTQLRDSSWPQILKLVTTEQGEMWQAMQALTELDANELRRGLAAIEYVSAAAQEQALGDLIDQDMPGIAEHLEQAGVYDNVELLERCDQMELGR